MYIYVYVNHSAVYLKRTQYCKSNFNIKKSYICVCTHTQFPGAAVTKYHRLGGLKLIFFL